MMEFWVATTNKGKMNEIKLILEKKFPQLVFKSVADLNHYSQPPENGKTFIDNARIKAKSLKAMKPDAWILAEDSGIEVEALNNLPGIHSARYAGAKARDSENVAKLLQMLKIRSAGNRKAQFVCQVIVLTPANEEIAIQGIVKGNISAAPKGLAGFGYDSVFIPEGQQQTFGELGLGFKNSHSHRAHALNQLIEKIQERL